LTQNNYIEEYLSNRSWRKKENANVNESFSGLFNYVSSKLFANDFLSALEPEQRKAHMDAKLHIHNLESGGYVPYSYNKQTPIIIKRNGEKMIVAMQDAKPGDYVLDKAGTEFTKITDYIYHNSHCDLLRIKLSNGSLLEVTEDHPVIMHYRLQTKQAKELKHGDLVQGCNISKRDFSFDGNEISRKIAWLIGIYIAEGNRTNSSFRITQKEGVINSKILQYLQDMALRYWISKDDDKQRFNIYIKQLEVNSFYTIKDYAENKNIPYEALTLQSYFDIISGIMDGDGCRQDSKFATRFKISTKSYELVNQIKLIFDVPRIVSTIRYSNDGLYHIEFYLTEVQLPLFRESIKVNSKPIIYFRGSKNLNYFSKEVRVLSIEKVPYVGNMVVDITTETSTFCSLGLKLHNCCGNNLKLLLLNGMKTPSINSKPAKHLNSVTDHVMNWLYCSQMEFSGAQSFGDFDTLIAPFVKKDKLSYNEVKQQIQKLCFNLNFTMRSSSQTPFTNLTLNYSIPKFLENEHAIIGGLETSFTYADCLDEVYMIDKAFTEVMNEMDPNGRPLTFPILTVNLTSRFPWDSEVAKLLANNCANIGSYYFMNYLGSGIGEDTARSMCCRLKIDLSKFNGPKGLWNMGEGVGSLGVVTINLPRIAFESKGKGDAFFFNLLEERLAMALNILKVRKERIHKYMKRLMPFSLSNGWSMKNYFMTIGIIGINEMCINYLDAHILESNGTRFTAKVLEFIREWTINKQVETKELINMEMVPAEGCSYRLALVDRKLNPKIFTEGTAGAPYYSSLLIPASYRVDILDKINFEEKLLPLFSGGTIFRTYLGDSIPSDEATLDFIKTVSKSKIPYFDITATYSVCPVEGKVIRGVVNKCPSCNADTEVYSRVVGYYRPFDKYNIGKRAEFNERRYTNI